jgi:hypothetical protein
MNFTKFFITVLVGVILMGAASHMLTLKVEQMSKDSNCVSLYNKYNIEPRSKSRKGWVRVFKSIPKMEAKGLQECIQNDQIKMILMDCIDNYLSKSNKVINQTLGDE